MIGHARYRIGELARISGVPVKTIRFYSDLGVLPPSEVSEGGHRLYSDLDLARLETVRSLRGVGLDLRTIARVMQSHAEQPNALNEVLRLQLETLNLELRQLQRRKTLLDAALRRCDALAYLRGAQALAELSARERHAFLRARLGRIFEQVPADPDWLEAVWGKQLLELPAELSDAQFGAWLELATLLSDEDFIAAMNRIGREYWGAFRSPAHREAFMQVSRRLEARLRAAALAGEAPDGPAGQRLIRALLRAQARAFGERATRAFARRQLERIARSTDPRAERFWELVAALHGWPASNESVRAAHAWQVRATEAYAFGAGRFNRAGGNAQRP
ncbi:DNA-binding transcriptional MerR regulator [Deinobacterium chartae]|uniref:DNA-binding transcriptional MerR regulator n=1 Tax=Deinobacterium chartae TaxID=521158 RepID=A0A841I2R1_9DEIO|nr:DNA-binding transcriptional MerR regulator [Deinobacterium chartae]